MSPVDAAQALIVEQTDLNRARTEEPQHAYGVEKCDLCECDLSTRGLFVMGKSTETQCGRTCACRASISAVSALDGVGVSFMHANEMATGAW